MSLRTQDPNEINLVRSLDDWRKAVNDVITLEVCALIEKPGWSHRLFPPSPVWF